MYWFKFFLNFPGLDVQASKDLFVKIMNTNFIIYMSEVELWCYADLPLNWIEKSGSDQQKIGIWGKKSGSWSNRLQKELTHIKSRLFVSFFLLLSQKECFELSDHFVCVLFMSFFVCCFCFYVCSFRPANSWLSFLTLVQEYSSQNFWVIFCYFAAGRGVMNPDKIKIWSI